MQKIAAEYKEQLTRYEEITNEMGQIHESMAASSGAYVQVNRNVYAGVSVSISDLSCNVKEKRSYCRFKKEDGEIKICAM